MMTSQRFKQCLLVFLLIVAVNITCGKMIYITPSLSEPCSQDQNPCFTLSQFAANTSCSDCNETGISLFLLPGNHSLDEVLFVASAENFSMMKVPQHNETVLVDCIDKSGRLAINGTTTVSIRGLRFIGCGGNALTNVAYFMLEDIIFQGVHGELKAQH